MKHKCAILNGLPAIAFVIVLSARVALGDGAGPLLKLLQSGKLPPERQPMVVEMVCKKGNADDLAYVFSQVLDPKAFSPELRLKALEWLTDAARINKVKPAGDLAPVKKLLTDADATRNPSFALAAIRLASLWQVPQMGAELKAILSSPTLDSKSRSAAIAGLVMIGDADSRSAIEQLATSGDSTATRFMAVAALAQLDLDAAAKAAAAAIAKANAQDDSTALVQAFLDRKGGPDKLAAALGSAKLSTDVAKRALRTMYSAGRSDAALSDVLSKAAGIAADVPPPTGDALVKLCSEVLAKGDAARGELVFRRADVNCMKCHSVSGGGGSIGPDLSPIGGTSPIDYVVNSILNPNLAIKELYVTRNIITSEGQSFSGIVVDRNDQQVKLKDASGSIITIPTADIEQEAEGQSLMPQGLTKFLTHDELLDLARFISELGKPGPYAVRSRPTVQRWRVLREPNEQLKTEVPNIEFLREWVIAAPPDAWMPAFGKVAGTLPLEEIRTATGQSVLYLQGTIDVIEPGPIGLRITCDRTTHTWLGATPMEQSREIVTEFNKGPYTVTVRVALDDKPAPELMAEFFKPEGSKAQFTVQ